MEEEYKTGSTLGSFIGFLLVILGGWFVYNNFISNEEWTGYFYYEPSSYDYRVKSPSTFDSLEECRQWVNVQVQMDTDGRYDYQCGLNCEFSPDIGEEICETDAQ